MGMKEDYQSAMEYAKAGKYKDAHKLVAPHKGKHRKIDKLIARLDSKIKRPMWQKILMYGAFTLVVCTVGFGAIWLATNWNFYFGGGKEDLEKYFSAGRVCSHVEAYYDIDDCDPNKMIEIYPLAVDYCYEEFGELKIGRRQETENWIRCLDNEGVFFEILDGD